MGLWGFLVGVGGGVGIVGFRVGEPFNERGVELGA